MTRFQRMFPEKTDAEGYLNRKVQSSGTRLMAYNETPIKCYGSIIIPYKYN